VLSTAPVVSGTAQVGHQLSTTSGTWTSAPTGYLYKWVRCDSAGSNCVDIANATSSQYTPVAADTGHKLRSEVIASNANGPASGYAPSLATSAVLPAGPPAISTAPAVSGTAAVAHQLSTTTGTWTNGPTTGYLYKWQRCDSAGSNCADIASATSAQYTLVAADIGHKIRSEVLASNVLGPASSYAPSAPTSVIPAGPPAISTAPVVTGTAAVAHQLSTTNGTWTNSPTSYLYQWQRCSNTGLNCVNIAGATSAHYTPVVADAGRELRSEVRASNAAGAAASYAPSAPTIVVVRKPALLKLPTLSGTAKVGKSLSVTTGTWNYAPTSYAYQWFRCTSTGTACKQIAGAAASSYLLKAADAGHKLEAKVIASNAAGSATATSHTSATVAK
jgi:hypothetical protein